jgi:2-oxoisovalerate dehydrogenase E1 component
LPSNLAEYTVPLGVPEVVLEGSDITIVSYGSTFNLCVQAAAELEALGISAELIDVQTLLPFDMNHVIGDSINKTSRVIFIDEDVPGGASAFMLDQVVNTQASFFKLDSAPKTLSAKAHLPAYGTDGDYISKPSIEDIVEAVYEMFNEVDPNQFPAIY